MPVPEATWETTTPDFRFWVEYGLRHGYLSQMFCIEHDSAPVTMAEHMMRSTPGVPDPCILAVRIFPELDESCATRDMNPETS